MTVDIEKLEALAKACGDLNWRAIQENWCEWAIRDDHAYIAIMRTKSAKQAGPCSDREAKAKFLCAVTPATVLELIADNKSGSSRLHELAVACATAEQERDQLKAENERISGENQRLRAGVESDMAEIDRIQAVYDAHFRKSRSYRMQLDSATEERDRLKAENAGLKTGYEAYERVNAELRAECEKLRKYGEEFASLAERRREQVEALRKDAERYRWLRDEAGYDWDVSYGKLEIRIETPHHDASDLDACIDAAMSKEQSHD